MAPQLHTLDRNGNGGGIIIYVGEDITRKMVTKHKFTDDIETLFIEINFQKCKWLLCGLYHPPYQCDQYFFDNLDKAVEVYSTYEKVSITGDFNALKGEKCLDTFLYQHELKSFNKEGTCYRNPNKPILIDLILTNSPRSFFNTETYFTGLSDCHKLVLSAFKTTFSKTGPKEMMHRDYKTFDLEIFSQQLRTSLSSETVHDHTSFEDNFLGVLEKYISLEKKVLRANHAPYVTKALRKAIM